MTTGDLIKGEKPFRQLGRILNTANEIKVHGFRFDPKVVRMPSYIGKQHFNMGAYTRLGAACDLCPAVLNVFVSPQGHSLCYKCWKKQLGIVTRPECEVTVNSRTAVTGASLYKHRDDGLYVFGACLGSFKMSCRKDLQNEINAALLRVTNPMPRVNQNTFGDFLRQVRLFLPTLLRDLKVDEFPSFEEWNSSFNKGRRTLNSKCWRAMTDGNGNVLPFSTVELRRVAKQLPFLKTDKDGHDDILGDKAARFIMAQTDATAVTLGMVLSGISRAIEKLWSFPTSNVVFACGKTPYTLSRSFMASKVLNGTNLDNDYSQYDASQHTQFCDLLVEIYDWILTNKCDEHLDPNLLHNYGAIRRHICGRTRARTRFGMLLVVNGQMKSGQADTCMGNTINNVLSHLYALARNNGTSMEYIYNNIIMHVLGDDNSTSIPRGMRFDRVERIMEELGLLPKLEVKEFDQIKFLNMIPYPVAKEEDGVDIRLAPMAGRFAERLFCASVCPPSLKLHLTALGHCVNSVASFHPFMRAMVESMWDVAKFDESAKSRKGIRAKGDRGYSESKAITQHLGWFLSQAYTHKDQPASANDKTFDFIKRRYGLDDWGVQRTIEALESPKLFHSDRWILRIIEADRC